MGYAVIGNFDLQQLAGWFYSGQADDLPTRIANHNRTDKIDGKFTRKNGPWVGAQ